MVAAVRSASFLFQVSFMKASFRSLCLALAITGMASSTTGAAASNDTVFFQRIGGQWSGPGEIVAGKYKGTKFVCNLQGEAGRKTPGMTLDGTCRVGVFSEKISASVEAGGGGYSGRFLDGAKGDGLDVVGGNVAGDKVVLSLSRAQLNGAMVARMKGADAMQVTVSVKVDGRLVPVVGMSLKRVDGIAVGAIASE